MAEPLTLRYNNPGALEFQPWMQKYGAQVGPNGRYAMFPNADAGFGVMSKVLDTYQNKHGLNTVSGIVNRWAPSNVDNNSTGTYIQKVAGMVGVDPNAPLGPEHRPALMKAMAHYEAGKPFPVSGTTPQPQQMPLSPASPSQPQMQSPRPMAQQDDNGLVGMFRNAIENPLVLAGLGLMGASAQGKDVGTGLLQGINQAREGDKFAEERKRRAAVNAMLSGNDPSLAGVNPALMSIARATGDLSPISQSIIKGGGTDDIKEYEYAVARGFKGSLQDWMVNKKASQGEYAKQLVYGTDPKGNPVPLQAGSRGDLVASKMPEGVTLQRDPIKFDLGDRYGIMDPTTRQIVGYVPKGLAEAETQKKVGEARGQAQADLPKVESATGSIVRNIDNVLQDKNLENVTGWNAYLPTIRSESHDTEARIAQLGGAAFLQAFESLKGGGAITEVEGQKATQALARLTNMKQTDGAYRQALEDFKSEVLRLQQVARVRAGGGQPQGQAGPPQAGQPQQLAPGTVMQGYRYKGGEPSNPASWEKAQ